MQSAQNRGGLKEEAHVEPVFPHSPLLFGEAGMEKLQLSHGAMGDIHDLSRCFQGI